MTAKQKDKILRVIEMDASAKDKYWDPETATMCVIGGLANAMGIDPRSIPNGSIQGKGLLCRQLAEHYGLREHQLQQLQSHNDRSWVVSERRTKLKDYIESLPVSDCCAA